MSHWTLGVDCSLCWVWWFCRFVFDVNGLAQMSHTKFFFFECVSLCLIRTNFKANLVKKNILYYKLNIYRSYRIHMFHVCILIWTYAFPHSSQTNRFSSSVKWVASWFLNCDLSTNFCGHLSHWNRRSSADKCCFIWIRRRTLLLLFWPQSGHLKIIRI